MLNPVLTTSGVYTLSPLLNGPEIRVFFYLSAKPDCRYLSTLKSNLGAWLDRYIFIRLPTGVWPFKTEW
ncbi:UNVERIFIED_CONTAM: hypothetical protein Sindi_2917500, partial [Sesamum indicum]